MGRWVLHLDMDAFFASVEVLTRPTLAGRAVLVGGLGPRGVVAGASYQARAYGARSAMPMARARRLCPAAVALPPRMVVYRVVSERVFAVVRECAGVLEQIAMDEAYAEPTSLPGAGPAEVGRFAAELRERVRGATGLAASVGAGSGKQLAKIASGLAKPDGVRVVPHGTERELLAPLPVRRLGGVGPVAELALQRNGVTTVGELAGLALAEVTALLGTAAGTELHRLARGIDDRPVGERGEAKQVSAETTFDVDLADIALVRAAVTELTAHAHQRLVAGRRAARTVTVKVRGGDFSTRTRSETVRSATTDRAALTDTAYRLVLAALPAGGVRLVGVSLSGLTSAVQQPLFDGSQLDGPQLDGPQLDEPPPTGETGPGAAGLPPPQPPAGPPERIATCWRAGDDVSHTYHGHGWVQGAGLGRVTVRFETRRTGPGPAHTFATDDAHLTPADPLSSLDW